MGLFDSIGDFLGSSSVKNLVGIGSLGFDIYSGVNAMNQANKLGDITYATAEKQNEMAKDMYDWYKQYQRPIDTAQAQYSLEDLQKTRDASEAYRDAYTQYAPESAAYGLQRAREQLAQAKAVNPILDQTEKSLITKLSEGQDVLSDRLRGIASTDVSQAFDKQRASDTRNMASYGVNPNSGAWSDYQTKMSQSQALADAGARTSASRQAEDTAISRQSQALNYSKGVALPSYQVSSTTPAATYGSSMQGISSALGGMSNLYNTYNTNSEKAFSGAAYTYDQMFGNKSTQSKGIE